MELVIYPRLSTRSRRALVRTNKQYGNLYTYKPRGNLIRRLAQDLNWTPEKVLEQIKKERKHLTTQPS